MIRAVNTLPAYRHYKPKNLAVVRIDGRDHYLGHYGSPESWRRYHELLAATIEQLQSSSGSAPAPNDVATKKRISIKELCLAYFEFAETYYVKGGSQTAEVCCIRFALRRLLKLFGDLFADEFGPKSLKMVRDEYLRDNLARSTINGNVSRIRRMFRWATENELLPVTVYQALATVPGLKHGRTTAREPDPVRPVSNDEIDVVLPNLPPPVRAMVQLQRMTGCRPGEVCQLRPCDVDCSSDTWVYVPVTHKSEHHGAERRIYLGPRAQDVLRPWLARPTHAFCFSPAEWRSTQNVERRRNRKSPMTPSQRARRPKRHPKRAARDKYDVASYRRAIDRACKQAKITPWSPNQLRHTRATELREKFGLDGAQVVLGHREVGTTQVYAEVNFARAATIMKEIG
jgi:integrase